ncbi:hypothetical protein M9Y10_030448 [Tritrichomonas musculus]|uniref:Protein kinase domain-containing protein n=1 Tax=Tritrichomonas musculus TaxID=1915356 RepID=A0ABR2H382_9EUKA
MSYLYKHDIEHEDLNPRNVLIDEKFQPKITEIGHYTLPQNLQNALSRSSIHINKTHIYFSPEIFRGESRTEKSEVYSFGKIIYEIITNKIDMKNTNKIFSNHLSTFDDESIPIIYKQLIEKCCSKDPQERPSFLDIVFQLSNDNKFITEDINIDIYNNYLKSIQ